MPPEQQNQDDFGADILETLSLSDESFEQPPTGPSGEADGDTTPTEPTAPGAGEGVVAPSPSPEPTPQPANAEPVPAAPEPAPATPQPGETPAPAAQPTPSAEPTVPTPPDEATLRARSLEAQVNALQAEISQLRAQGATPEASGQSGQAPESGQPQLKRYDLTLPQPLFEALSSDDDATRYAATSKLVSDTAMIVHNTVMSEVRGVIGNLLNAATQDQTAQQMAKDLEAQREEYYSAFPDHKDPLYLPIIASESAKLAAEYPGLSWGPDFINSLGARVRGYAQSLAGGAAPAVTPVAVPGQAPPARPAASITPVGGAPRAAAPIAAGQDDGSLIIDTLGFGFDSE